MLVPLMILVRLLRLKLITFLRSIPFQKAQDSLFKIEALSLYRARFFNFRSGFGLLYLKSRNTPTPNQEKAQAQDIFQAPLTLSSIKNQPLPTL